MHPIVFVNIYTNKKEIHLKICTALTCYKADISVTDLGTPTSCGVSENYCYVSFALQISFLN